MKYNEKEVMEYRMSWKLNRLKMKDESEIAIILIRVQDVECIWILVVTIEDILNYCDSWKYYCDSCDTIAIVVILMR